MGSFIDQQMDPNMAYIKIINNYFEHLKFHLEDKGINLLISKVIGEMKFDIETAEAFKDLVLNNPFEEEIFYIQACSTLINSSGTLTPFEALIKNTTTKTVHEIIIPDEIFKKNQLNKLNDIAAKSIKEVYTRNDFDPYYWNLLYISFIYNIQYRINIGEYYLDGAYTATTFKKNSIKLFQAFIKAIDSYDIHTIKNTKEYGI